ncbi:MAG: fibronectin type III domain-containing protein [Prevotella sp.]|nr:fibronectin type III domain-containing protein [Prevotella sp.]
MNRIFSACVFGLAVAALTSCSDASDAIESIILNRNLSPINIQAKDVQETSATITWDLSSGADVYEVQFFQDDSLSYGGTYDSQTDAVTPAKTISGVTADDLPLLVEDLVYDTKYTVRVRAITSNDASRISKWHGVYFRTSAQQILNSIKQGDYTDRSVTVSWPEGEEVTTIVVGNVTHQITEEEKAAGKATVTGLEPQTVYTVYLLNNGKQRGNRTFTTLADLEGSIPVSNADELVAAVEAAQDGDAIALIGPKYVIPYSGDDENITAGSLKITKSITLKGVDAANRPIVNGRLEINDGAALTTSLIIYDGEGTSGDQAFNYKTAGVTYGALLIDNCEIKNYTKGVFYLNVASVVESVTFNNCIIHDIPCSGGDMFDSRAGLPKAFNLTNSTVYNSCATRDFIRIDDASSNFSGQPGPIVTVNKCTLYKVGNGNSNRQLIYVRFAGNEVIFKNNLVMEFNNTRGFTNQSSCDPTPELQNNYYYHTVNLISLAEGNTQTVRWFDTDGTNLADNPCPQAEEADFTIDANSPVKSGNAGDPRWIK